jgi:hypothetical protein
MVAQRKYPEELRDRAVRLVLEVREREGRGRGEIFGQRHRGDP